MSARDDVLMRIRSALADKPAQRPVPRDYRLTGETDPTALRELLIDRLRDYKASVRLAPRASIEVVVAAALADRGLRTLAVPVGLDERWLADAAAVDLRRDSLARPLAAAALDGVDGVLTASALAIAETGTIVLDGSAGQGRRVLTLVPDYHLCVVVPENVVATVPEGLRRLDASRAQTWISGPSATSDIELQRVEGVHGPRTLEVIVVVD
ncbi:MAG: L-lactate dehydrogenase complex protein LldG [Frankiaceae bacterium]|nr:L-lactate dehydrogenase complex protein LldG [Frankiaceae bacterium]